MPRKKAADPTSAEAESILAYKGFNADMTCRGFAYEVGRSYRHAGPVKACEAGFHACEHPLDVLSYYGAAASRFALVEMSGETSRDGDDSKIAAAEITIKTEIRLPELVAAAIRYVTDRCTWIEGSYTDGERQGVKTARDQGAATASGDRGAATASGYQGAATASGDQGAATASGDRGAATASGYQGAATASGYDGKARGSDGCALFLVERDRSGKIVDVWAGIAGRDGIEPNSWYALRAGQPVRVD